MPSTEDEKTAELLVMERLRKKREAMSLSQADVGKMIGVSYQQVHKMETGANRMPWVRLIRLAKRLDYPLEDLFKGVIA
jgi:transcriptional regulator with XRE-family HTH domain